MTKVTKIEHDVKVIRHTWKCPGCNCAMNQSEKPEQYNLLCYSCVLTNDEQKWRDEHAFLLNSTVVSLLWTTSMGFRGMLVVDADGSEWAIRGPMSCEAVTK